VSATGVDVGPIAIVDVDYAADGSSARAACVLLRRFADERAIEEHVVDVGAVAPYHPGRFFERELPCLLEVLARARERPAVVVIDGYVTLDAAGAPGLGAHLHERLGGAVAVVGVAKRAFRGAPMAAPVLRGGSARPLYVTARGLDVADAARLVGAMHGAHRIPTLLRRVDRLARGLVRPGER
jgi:deoxyribonuclease V